MYRMGSALRIACASLLFLGPIAYGKTLRVPSDYSTLNEALDAAQPNDTVMLAPGTYTLAEYDLQKPIRLVSKFDQTRNESDIRNTIIEGAPLTISASGTEILGLTWKSANKGIIPKAIFDLQHCVFQTGGDAVDYEKGSGGYLAFCTFENNGDDGIDLDQDVEILIEHNIIRNNRDDGIEIRLQPYTGPLKTYIIRHNIITGNGEDGIQLIDYPGVSNRIFTFYGNLLAGNAMAGIGFMPDGNTKENYEGSPQVERVVLYGNTFQGNDHGLTGGQNVIAFNNVFVGNKRFGAKLVGGNSVIVRSLFYENGIDCQDCNLGEGILYSDPVLDKTFRPLEASPCIDAGIQSFGQIEVVGFRGKAPDLGSFEFGSDPPGGNVSPHVDCGPDRIVYFPNSSLRLRASVEDDGRPNPPAQLTLRWKQVSGDQPVSFSTPEASTTDVTLPEQGVYLLSLSATDGELETLDQVEVKYVSGGGGRSFLLADKSELTIEAEDFSWAYGQLQTVEKANASGQKAVQTLSSPGSSGFAEYQIIIPMEDTSTYGWIRASVPNGSEGSLRASWNRQEPTPLEIPRDSEYHWARLPAAGLPAGAYPLWIRGGGPGVQWDQLILTSDADLVPGATTAGGSKNP